MAGFLWLECGRIWYNLRLRAYNTVQRSNTSTGVSLKKAVNTVQFLADIRVPKENYHAFVINMLNE
jgi:hypothetical protein